ncbi:hypothetical protein HZY97_03970 [Sphingomonas sp. R-74633]|uniref:hypothetical protein n=1 Tax=Sphingomonas sp. R-74633 TaxID=2751188 RepID=UPI0015D16F3C|nr:hypothetical protein [Sphingomonas sp. R-74633]NYT39902.1 hypothetical protein [Sphingomonas sp. R-74633]
MTARIALALLWLAALLGALLVTEAYFWVHDADGYPLLLPPDRSSVYPPVVAIYSATIAPLLAALYFRPFAPPASAPRGKALNRLALALTGFYNALLLYLLAQGFWHRGIGIEEIVSQAKQAALLLGFLVVPVNAYYFGIKGKAGED